MAIGKNKKLGKKGKGKKKQMDPFLKKDWYNIRAPSYFTKRTCGKTLITRTQGTKVASEEMMGRVFEICLADLNNDEDQSFRKMKLVAEEVQGENVLCNFQGMDFTRDKLCSLIKKWQSLIEAYADIRTTDGYYLRIFTIGFTKKRQNQIKKACYAKASQCKAIRNKMVDVVTEEASKCELKELVQKFIPEIIGKEIEKACNGIYPLQNVFVRKVKILKKPKFDITKLMEIHGDSGEDTGLEVNETPEVEELAGSGGRL
jgi:small subunit ribosomal protein S3Ae